MIIINLRIGRLVLERAGAHFSPDLATSRVAIPPENPGKIFPKNPHRLHPSSLTSEVVSVTVGLDPTDPFVQVTPAR